MTLHPALTRTSVTKSQARGLVAPTPAKLATPRDRAGLISRPRLLGLLAAHTDRPLVVVSAPPGYGKSTLVAQWSRTDGRRFAWVTLDRADNDPVVLVSSVLGAVAALGFTTPDGRPTALTGQEPAFTTRVLPFVARLVSTPPGPFVLVLDDVHLASGGRCREILEELVLNLAPGSQLVIVSRTRPPLPLARLAALGTVLELGPSDLAFDRDECARALRAGGLQPTAADVDDVTHATEGWPVAVYLTALARPHGAEVSLSPDHTRAADLAASFIDEEVLDWLDPDTVSFLTRTSVLSSLSGPLADAVTGGDRSAALLARLAGENSLVIPLEGQDGWYRYHNLLADALRTRLRHTEPGLIPTLHMRASRWYAEQGELEEAVRYARLTGELGWLSELVWRDLVAMVCSGRGASVARWLDGLHDRQVAANPRLSLAAGWLAFERGDVVATERWRRAAERWAGPGWRDRIGESEILASLALLESVIGVAGLEHQREVAERCYALLAPDSEYRPLACYLAGLAHLLLGDTRQGIDRLREAADEADLHGQTTILANSLASLALAAVVSGDWDRAFALVARAHDEVTDKDLRDTTTGAHVFTVSALTLSAAGEAEAAVVQIGEARAMVEAVVSIIPWFAVLSRALMAWSFLLLDDVVEARRLVAQARQLSGPASHGPTVDALLADVEARVQAATEARLGVSGALTPAEFRVLEYLPTRLSTPEIAERLVLSRHTVKSQIMAVYRKLGASSRSEAVAKAEALSLVPHQALHSHRD